MQNPLHPLDLIVRRLDALGMRPSVADLAWALDVALTPDFVALFLPPRDEPHSRAPVIRNERYELFVSCWRAGHESVPHDHGASACVLKVIQGTAVERTYRVADDGFVDVQSERALGPGDSASLGGYCAHSTHNASPAGERLIALQLYAPPSQSTRRFRPRPGGPNGPRSAATKTVAVIGGGFSGAIVAAHLLRNADAPLRVALIEKRGALGEGVAYSTPVPEHLLNVPAGRMSAFPDQPDDFLRWASRRDAAVHAADFLPRGWYGEYIREALQSAVADGRAGAGLDVVFDEAQHVAKRVSGRWTLHFGSHSSIDADAIVLAIGHSPPSDPLSGRWLGARTRFIPDPWSPFALKRIGRSDRVLILGSGLTAVDAMLVLHRREHDAEILLVSPRGLAPQSHAARPVAPADLSAIAQRLLAAQEGVKALALLRAIRRAARETGAEGGDWRAVVDGLRPHTIGLWRAMSTQERRRFVTHARPFWEVHRHRMASSVGEIFARLRRAGRLRILAGRVEIAREDGAGVTALVRRAGALEPETASVEWIVNCTGPRPSNTPESNPVVESLLAQRRLRLDPLRLGVETTMEGNAINADGEVEASLFVVGTLRKPADWESTAVPELREQASAAARRVADYLAAPT